MSALLARVQTFAERHAMWRPETRVIAAVSGGSDSVALLRLLHDLHQSRAVTLDAVAHLHHGIRGRDADDDQSFCQRLAEALDVPFVSDRQDVPARAQRDARSVEVAAREARREFFDRVLATRGADCLATAHTADDQAETVLLRIARGTGVTGLGGIAPVAGRRVRPLLECSRAELTAALAARGQDWREDSTNADLGHPRNRVRHELLPYLERHFNPAVRRALCRLADLARADDEALRRHAMAAAEGLATIDGDRARLDRARLNALPVALARRVVRQTLEALDAASPSWRDVDAVRAVAAGEVRAAATAFGRVEHSCASVVLVCSGSAPSPPAPFRLDLPVPGRVELPGTGWVIEAHGPQPRQVPLRRSRSSRQVEIDAERVRGGLVVRSRQPGDRIRPLGLDGRKKVQDVLVDRKVARGERDRVPIVTDGTGRLIWVAGHVLGEDVKVTDRTNAVVILNLRRL